MSTVFNSSQILSLICDILHVHCAVLLLPDQHGTCTVVDASGTVFPLPVAATVTPGKGLVGWILRNEQPLILNNFNTKQSFLGYYDSPVEEEHVSAFMGVAVPGGGALCVDSLVPRAFSTAEQHVLSRFAALLVPQKQQDMTNMSLPGETERYFETFEELQNIRLESLPWRTYLSRFLTLLAKASQFEYVALAMLPEGSTMYTVEGESRPLLLTEGEMKLPVATGLVGWVLRNEGMAIYAEGTESAPIAPLFGNWEGAPRFQSTICLPVWHAKAICGTLIFANNEPCPLPESLRTFARMAANELGLYIEALYLHHRVQRMLLKAAVHLNAPKQNENKRGHSNLHD